MPSVTLAITGSPKRRLVDMALGKCGIIGADTDTTAFALNELDALMLTWPFNQLGFVQPLDGTGSLEDLSGIDPMWDLAVSLALAETISPLVMNGQPLSPTAQAQKVRQMAALRAFVATIPGAIMVFAPSGEGNRRLGRVSPFIRET